MTNGWCPQCGRYMYAAHKCPSQWDVWEQGEKRGDHSPVYGDDAQDAAEQYARRSDTDSAEYDFMKYGGAVTVAPVDDGCAAERFFVEGESVPEYHARPVKP